VFNLDGGVFLTFKNNRLRKNALPHVAYQFLKWISFCTVICFYTVVLPLWTAITQLVSFCMKHSLQCATNVF